VSSKTEGRASVEGSLPAEQAYPENFILILHQNSRGLGRALSLFLYPAFRARVAGSLKRGIWSGLTTTWILVKVMVPTMIAVHIFKAVGILDFLAEATSPLMGFLRLPGEAALVLITGGLVNIYAAIAVAVNIPLTSSQMTVLAIMVLIAHNLVVETAVQSQAGTPAPIMLTARIGAALMAGFLFSRLVAGDGILLNLADRQTGNSRWQEVVAWNVLSLVKIAFLILGLMMLVELLREFGIMDRLTRLLEKPMTLLGMNHESAFVVAVGLLLGLAYGAGLIIEEARSSRIGRKEILATNLFLGTNHSLIEDSLLFAAVGAHLGWIILGRLVFGIVFLRIAAPLALSFLRPEAKEAR